MGTASKVTSVVFRVFELCCAIIVASIIGRFLYVLDLGGGSANSKIIYAEVIAGLSVGFSILLMLPFMYLFWAFPLDFAIFVCWMVAFGLLDNTCSSYWYWNYWGFYWGRFWTIPRHTVTASVVGTAGCSSWRAILAFCMIGGLCWLVSSLIGFYVILSKRSQNHPADMAVSVKQRWPFKREKEQIVNPGFSQSSGDNVEKTAV